jgi:hypothetical protein
MKIRIAESISLNVLSNKMSNSFVIQSIASTLLMFIFALVLVIVREAVAGSIQTAGSVA